MWVRLQNDLGVTKPMVYFVQEKTPSNNPESSEWLWEKFSITEEIWREAKEKRDQITSDMSWLGPALLASIEDCVFRWDLMPPYMLNHQLHQVVSLQYSMHVEQAMQGVKQGFLLGSLNRFDSELLRDRLNIFPTKAFCDRADGPIAFGLHASHIQESFRVYRGDLRYQNNAPLIRLIFSSRDLSDLYFEIDVNHYGHPIYTPKHVLGFFALSDVQYEFLFEGAVPLSEFWDISVDPHHQDPCNVYGSHCPQMDQDENVVRILAFLLTWTSCELVRLLKRDATFFGLNYLSAFRIWLKDLNLDYAGADLSRDDLHQAFSELASGNFERATAILKQGSALSVSNFVADKVVEIYGFSSFSVRLYLFD